MNATNLCYVIIIITIYVLLFLNASFTFNLNYIKLNWPMHRCNPLVMIFADSFGHDKKENFAYCIQSMQGNYLSYLLQPLNYSMAIIARIGKALVKALSSVRHLLSHVRSFLADIINTILGIFSSLIIFVIKFILNIKDILLKLIAVFATVTYTIRGSIFTMSSAWSGPPGQLVRFICFHPDTLIRLKNNSLVKMKDIPLNSKLKTGTIVYSVMKISNIDENNNQVKPLYKVPYGENDDDILVTGSHLIFDPEIKDFVEVKNLNKKYKSTITNVECKELCCLITSDNTIPIGKWIFHDWEDNNGSVSKKVI
tara:strand:- start:2134 stop:3066 length:933 start_codon:yes stop_codon:yes gene_type:complete